MIFQTWGSTMRQCLFRDFSEHCISIHGKHRVSPNEKKPINRKKPNLNNNVSTRCLVGTISQNLTERNKYSVPTIFTARFKWTTL
jgi:hypothetical protein